MQWLRLTSAFLLLLTSPSTFAMPPVSNRAEADAYFESHRAPSPDGYEITYNDCADDNCSLDRAVVAEALQLAYLKDYQAQRNLAYCLQSGCGGAIATDRAEACAWRYVIVASDDPQLDQSDALNLDHCTNGQPAGVVRKAKERATALVLSIYGEQHLQTQQ